MAEVGITDKQKEVIGGLINGTDVLGKRVLASYDPSRSYGTNLHHVKNCKSKELETCGKLLGLKVKSEDGKETKLYRNRDILADRIIMKIESLFEAKCSECDEMYQNTLQSEPVFQCRLCMLGSHDCQKIREKADQMSAERPKVVVWMCHECLGKNDLDNMQPAPKKKEKKKKKEKTDGEASNSETKTNILEPAESGDEKSDEEGDEEDTAEEIAPVEDGVRVTAKRGKDVLLKDDEGPEKKPPICKNYMKRNCPHGHSGTRLVKGKTCEKQHPKRCYKYCDFGANHPRGCNKGKSCEFWHPRICTASRNNEVCKKDKCTFQHLAHTRESRKEVYKREDIPESRAELQVPRERRGSTAALAPKGVKIVEKGEDTRDESSSFLLKLVEEMRAGIQEQLQEMRAEIRRSKETTLKIPAGAASSPGQCWMMPPWYNQGFQKLSC